MSKKCTPADAELLLKLYDLRRESEMRKARNWWLGTFSPESADDVLKLAMNMGTPENNWLRQVSGYWNMAASLVEHGALNRELFLEPSSSGEMYFLFAKVKPFVKELRQKMNNPHMYANIESVINSTKQSREFLKFVEGNLANRRKAMAEASKAAKAS